MLWKRTGSPSISAVALDLGEKVQELITLLDTLYNISFPDVFNIKNLNEKSNVREEWPT